MEKFHTCKTWKTCLAVKLACSQDHMFARLLLESLDTRIGLAQQLQATKELWHIRRVFGLEGNTNYRCSLESLSVKSIPSSRGSI